MDGDPLHSAAISGHLKKPQMENINPENNHGQPPLHSANGTFEFNFVNASKITKIISNLKNTKALGVDNIATEVWKKGKITLF